MTTDVLINWVLDRSGSMGVVVPQTIDGFNTFLKEQQDQEGNAWMSLTLFDTAFDVRYVAEPIKEIPMMDTTGPNRYTIGGSTALYDAVGTTIKGTEQWLTKHPEFRGKVITVVLTDGQENASREWHIFEPRVKEDAKDINNLIEYKQAEGWQFVFLGAGKSAWLEGQKFAPTAAHLNYAGSAGSTRQTYAGTSSSVSSLRSGAVADMAAPMAAMASSLDDQGEYHGMEEALDKLSDKKSSKPQPKGEVKSEARKQ